MGMYLMKTEQSKTLFSIEYLNAGVYHNYGTYEKLKTAERIFEEDWKSIMRDSGAKKAHIIKVIYYEPLVEVIFSRVGKK